MSWIANLPWYDFDELEAATDAWWRGVRRHLEDRGLRGAPERLARDGDYAEQWRSPDLLLSQACGYDVLYDARDDLQVLAAPVYAAPGCEGGGYRSAILVRADSRVHDLAGLRGSICVINDRRSHSGTNALRPCVAPLSTAGRFFAQVRESHSHRGSMRMVACGEADVACVDGVVLGLCDQIGENWRSRFRVLQWTELAPAPPYVASRRLGVHLTARLRGALRAAIADPALRQVRARLLLKGCEPASLKTYESLRVFEESAILHGYQELPAPDRSPLTEAPPERAPSKRPACAGPPRRES